MMPLFLKLATQQQADPSAILIRSRLERAPAARLRRRSGSGQQWDAPNGWAPLEWMTIEGLRNYGQRELASEIARRWIALNRCWVYRRTGRLVEKYGRGRDLTAGRGRRIPGPRRLRMDQRSAARVAP